MINPSESFPDGAIVDPWAGRGVTELNDETRREYEHSSENIEEVASFKDWIKEEGKGHLIEDFKINLGQNNERRQDSGRELDSKSAHSASSVGSDIDSQTKDLGNKMQADNSLERESVSQTLNSKNDGLSR